MERYSDTYNKRKNYSKQVNHWIFLNIRSWLEMNMLLQKKFILKEE